MIKALLDTHTLVWFAWDMPELPTSVKTVLEDPETVTQVSIASFWEIGIKASLGKWSLPGDVLALQAVVEGQGIEILPITVPAIHLLTQMEHHHKDPFDRLLAATALSSGATLLSADTIFDQYRVARFGAEGFTLYRFRKTSSRCHFRASGLGQNAVSLGKHNGLPSKLGRFAGTLYEA